MIEFISRKVINIFAGKGHHSKLLVFSFHDVYESTSIFSKTSIKFEYFNKKIRWINRHFDIVPLSEGVELCRSGKLKRPTACLTFDDGFASHSELVLPLLLELNIKASFFISSEHLDENLLWNDALTVFYQRSSRQQWLDISDIIYSLAKIKGDYNYFEVEQTLKYLTLKERGTVITRINQMVNVGLDKKRMLSNEQIINLDKNGMECGAHTVHHPILMIEDIQTSTVEIVDDLIKLRNVLNKVTKTFAYPNGKPKKDFNEHHLNVLANNRVKYAVTTSPGYFVAGSDPLQIPRVSLIGKNSFQYLRCIVSNYNFLGDFVECRGYEAKD
jgi:peptidoglycan/xylan/chitin deacetylase (PgdA/CDA1 family)